MTDVDASLVQKVLNVAQGQRETNVHHHRKADDLGRCFEVAKRAAFCHMGRLANRPSLYKEFALTKPSLARSQSPMIWR